MKSSVASIDTQQTVSSSKSMNELMITAQLVNAVAPHRTSGTRTTSQNLNLFETIRNLLDQLLQIQNDDRFTAEKLDQLASLESFTQWLHANGINTDGISIKKVDDSKDVGLGIFSTRQIHKGECLVKIPLKLILSNDTSAMPALNSIVKSNVLLKTDPSVILVIRLLQEYINPMSLWQPYFDLLPRVFTIPVLGSAQDLAAYTGTSIIDEVVHDMIALMRQYLYLQHIFKSIPEPPIPLADFTFAAFSWARAIVSTRQNEICYANPSTSEMQQFLCLIPLFDMFNHKPGNSTTQFDTKEYCSETIASCDVSPGEQIFIHYGKRSNQEMLLYSGFVDPTNIEYDHIKLSVSIPQSDPIRNQRVQLLKLFNLSSESRLNLCGPPVLETSSQLILFLKVLTMDAVTINAILATSDPVEKMQSDHTIYSLSVTKALEWVRLRCMILKRALQKTIETDKTTLQSGNADNPVKLRVAEYEFLSAIEIDISSQLVK